MKKQTMEKITNVMMIILISFLVSLAMFFILESRKTQIGTADITGLVREHENALTKLLYSGVQKYTPDQQVDLSQQSRIADLENKRFAEKLDKAVKQVGKECKCILINKAALLADTTKAKDYTARIKELMK